MIELTLDNGKAVMRFTIEGTSVLIKDLVTGQEFKAEKEMFSTQAKEKRSQMELRRKKGEKFYKEWKDDLKKYCSFNSESEVEEDIMKDFVKDKGWRIINRIEK